MAKSTNTPEFWGMVMYDKIGDGCLSGVWNNNDLNNRGRIHNEIARKSDGKLNKVDGLYTVSWIERNNEAISGVLRVTPINNDTAFLFRWIVEKEILFSGVAMEIGTRQIAVTYWDGDSTTFPAI